ncbi:hypothetical protein HYDPIDRAFT_168382 [Hydnomerulius pinastri MD-312]|uniref:FAD-binding domain-containing protein n=1 Tax=Hydnomerulius pinastri MD-312 TaxID=994086 RepID=A0A0C9W831_9AGAM|nr:hypothetical protein HYDPIDRAFT_168382 [Hydnomerulius pinastri MD-312]
MSESKPSPRFRVAICGTGISGLVLAITIGKYARNDVPIDIYEAHDSIVTPGAGIAIWRRTLEIMEELGVYEDLEKVGTRPSSSSSSHGPHYRKADLKDGGFDWFHLVLPDGGVKVQRRDLVLVLQRHLPANCTLHFRKRLVTYASNDSSDVSSIVMRFSDGTTASTDVLIGADGIRSAVRKIMFEDIARSRPETLDIERLDEWINPSWTGVLVYRCVFPTERLVKIRPDHPATREMILYCGRGHYVVSYPMAHGTQINLAAFVLDSQSTGKSFDGLWVTDVSREELLQKYEDFEPQAKELLQCCDRPSRWALHTVNELPLSTFGRVAITGDACHAMTPHLGAGAGQAVEDAFVLGRLLSHPLIDLPRVPVALQVYQDIRLPFSIWAARESLRTGWMYFFMAPGFYDSIDRSNEAKDLEVLSREIEKQWAWQGTGGSVDEWKRAEKELCDRLGHLRRKSNL